MTARKFFIVTVFITLGLFALPALTVAVFDPFSVYHKPFIHKDIGVRLLGGETLMIVAKPN